MRKLLQLAALMLAGAAYAEPGPVVGVSWSNFQEERWKTDEAALRAGIEAGGGDYLAADAQSSTEKQIADIESLIARGARVLVVVAQDADAIRPAITLAEAEGLPVIAYDRLIELPGVFYMSFDNREVGRLQARELLRVRPEGNYVFIKGSPQDPNSDFVHSGQLDVLGPAIDSGKIRVVGNQYVDGWLPQGAQRITEQILTANENKVDVVVCSNDGMAGGVVAALAAVGLEGLPVSGQDGDHAALSRVARGLQTVSVWKDARELGREAARVALALASGTPGREVQGASIWRGERHRLDAILLAPVAITAANLQVVVDAGWISKDALCRGADEGAAQACR